MIRKECISKVDKSITFVVSSVINNSFIRANRSKTQSALL